MRVARRIGGVGWSGVSACGVKIYKPNNYYKQIKLEFIISAKQQVVNILYTRFLLFFGKLLGCLNGKFDTLALMSIPNIK